MKHPGGLKRPGWFVLRKASGRHDAHASAPNKAGGKMAPTASRKWSAEINLYVICIFSINKEEFNGISSTKTDIYFALGCVWFADPSIKRY